MLEAMRSTARVVVRLTDDHFVAVFGKEGGAAETPDAGSNDDHVCCFCFGKLTGLLGSGGGGGAASDDERSAPMTLHL